MIPAVATLMHQKEHIMTKPYQVGFGQRHTDPDDAFLPDTARHPVFELTELPA